MLFSGLFFWVNVLYTHIEINSLGPLRVQCQGQSRLTASVEAVWRRLESNLEPKASRWRTKQQTVMVGILQENVIQTRMFGIAHIWLYGHFTHETESPWPVHFQHSHWWKRRSRSKFASHYAWGTNGVCECKMVVKSTWNPTWHWMDHVSRSLGLFSKTVSWRKA